MDSHEWNKIIGAVLGTLIFVMVIKIASESLFDVAPPAKPGYVVEGVQEPTATNAAAPPVEEAMPDWGTVLASADVAKGHDISHRCEQCHDLSKGGPNKIGPNLYGVVGRARASHPGFDYSSAMKAKGGSWTFDEFFKFLKSPQAYIEGTKMSFAGLPATQDRINIIAYLRTLSDSPVAIPPPAPAKAAAPATATTPGAAPVPGGARPANAPTSNTPTPTPTVTPAANPQGGPAKPASTPATPPKKS
jgi:cytochrome c